MPELRLQNPEWLVSAQEPSIACGNAFLPDKFAAGKPNLAAWDPKNINDRSFERTRIPVSATPGANQGNYEGSTEVFSLYCRYMVGQTTVCLPTTGWPEKKDPFTQTNLLDSEEEKVLELFFRFRTSISIPYREKLADRLVTLFYDAKEEDFASVGISLGSLQNFYNFLRLYTNLKCPTISLTPENNIYASWRAEQNRVFSVHFLSDGDTRFVMFRPNDLHPERQIRISGTATADILMATVAPYGVEDWIYK
jgi:hypothetical protein